MSTAQYWGNLFLLAVFVIGCGVVLHLEHKRLMHMNKKREDAAKKEAK